jgi:hypothetical protein
VLKIQLLWLAYDGVQYLAAPIVSSSVFKSLPLVSGPRPLIPDPSQRDQ